MYTLEELKQKSLKELKAIGYGLSVLPESDRRCRQNWIDALVGVQPPLLELLKVSPDAEVESVEEAIEFSEEELDRLQEMREYYRENEDLEPPEGLYMTADEVARELLIAFPPSPEVQAQELPIESKFGRIAYPKPAVLPIAQSDKITPGTINGDAAETDGDAATTLVCSCADSYNQCLDTAEPYGGSGGTESSAFKYQKGDRALAATGDGQGHKGRALLHQSSELRTFNDEQPPNRGDGKGRVDPELSESAIAPAAKTSPGVSRKTSTAHELLALFKAKAHTISDSPVAKTESELSKSAIVQTAKNSLDAEAEQNPIFTGITLSDSFLARYSPPQPENIHYQADADGQLNLLDFQIPATNEPPDPDDFDCMFAFWAAYDAWVGDDEEGFAPLEDNEPLEISLNSFCEWAPVPDDWYEPDTSLEPSEVLEHSTVGESSSTCKFLIPVFDAWCDRPNRQTDSDEPPDTGIFARLPKPKPPSFPPMGVVAGDRTNSIKKFARSATHLSGRDPPAPGGDATM